MDNKNLLILGTGQYSAVVYEIAEAMGCFEKIDFLDDNTEQAEGSLMCDGKIIGKISELEKFAGEYSFGIAAEEEADLRYLYTCRLEENCYRIPVLVHPKAFVGKYAHLGKGCVVEAMATVQSGTELGTGVLVSAGAVIDHSVLVSDYCHIGAGSVVPAKSVLMQKTNVEAGKVYPGIMGYVDDEAESQNASDMDANLDWIQDHIKRYGKAPDLFEGA